MLFLDTVRGRVFPHCAFSLSFSGSNLKIPIRIVTSLSSFFFSLEGLKKASSFLFLNTAIEREGCCRHAQLLVVGLLGPSINEDEDTGLCIPKFVALTLEVPHREQYLGVGC